MPYPTRTGSASSSHSLSNGAIAGIAIACFVVGFGLVGGIVFFFKLKYRRGKRQDQHPDGTERPPDKNDEDGAYGKQELDAGVTASPIHEISGQPIEHYKPGDPEQPDASPSTPLPPDPVYEMVGDGPNLPELPASITHPEEVE